MTNLEVENVAHLEPANFWIGPSAVRTILIIRQLSSTCKALRILYFVTFPYFELVNILILIHILYFQMHNR